MLLSFCPSMCAQPQEEDLCKVTGLDPMPIHFRGCLMATAYQGAHWPQGIGQTPVWTQDSSQTKKARHQLSPWLWVGSLGLLGIWQRFPCLALGG